MGNQAKLRRTSII